MEKKQKYNQEIVNALAIKYGVSTRYVRSGLSETNKSVYADTIKKDYKKAIEASQKAISESMNIN